MERPKLLITGINGLIGGILRRGLAGEYEIYGLDRSGPFGQGVFQADIVDYDGLAGIFQQAAPFEYLVHLAGVPDVDAPWQAILENNIIGTRNVYEAARLSGVRRVVFASSNHVTGAYEGFPPRLHEQPEPLLIGVQDPIRPDSDYGVSKAFGEALARYYCARWGLESICLRIGAVIPGDSPGQDRLLRKIWLSHRDLVQLVRKSLQAKATFGIYYGVSDNKGRFWDISNAKAELGYAPED